MQATRRVQVNKSQQAEVARLLLQANLSYGESNRRDNSFIQRIKHRQECRSMLREALTLQPRNANALGLMGRVEMDDGALDAAYSLFNNSLKHQPGQPQQYCNLGYWALRTERPAQAEQYFLQALEYDRQLAAAFCGIAHAKRLQGQFDVAFLHYRKLLDYGADWDSVYSGMLDCACELDVNQVDDELVADAIALLSKDGLAHQELGRFAAAILRQRYGLDQEDAQVSLDDASSDPLLLLALQKTLLPDAEVEELVTLLRRAIISEVAQTVELRDELQQLTLALAVYADRTGYALAVEDDEQQLITAINESIQAQFVMAEPQDSMIGSLMISAMYGALFHQPFAVSLGQWALVDWPVDMQPVMAASYYDRATDEAIKQNFEEKAAELCLDRADVPHACPAWATLSQQTESSLHSVLTQDLGLPADEFPDILRLMVCGARSGQRALELAHYLSDVEVIAVDESLANIAKGTRMAEQLGIDNIVFWPWSVAQRFVADEHKVHWIEIGRLPSARMTDVSLAALVNSATNSGAIVHMHTGVREQTDGDRQIRQLIARHQLKPTRATLRQLRKMALNNRQDTGWQSLTQDADFYSLDGCRDRWFAAQNAAQLNDLMGLVSNEVDWKLVKARDSDGHSLATGPVQKQIQAETLGSEVQSLLGQELSVYFQKRR